MEFVSSLADLCKAGFQIAKLERGKVKRPSYSAFLLLKVKGNTAKSWQMATIPTSTAYVLSTIKHALIYLWPAQLSRS
jgi:hypothetical protein